MSEDRYQDSPAGGVSSGGDSLDPALNEAANLLRVLATMASEEMA